MCWWEGERFKPALIRGWKVKLCIDVSEGERVKYVLMRGWKGKICTDKKVKGKTCTNDRVIYMNSHNVHEFTQCTTQPESYSPSWSGGTHSQCCATFHPWHSSGRSWPSVDVSALSWIPACCPLASGPRKFWNRIKQNIHAATESKPTLPNYCLQTSMTKVLLMKPCYQMFVCKPPLLKYH